MANFNINLNVPPGFVGPPQPPPAGPPLPPHLLAQQNAQAQLLALPHAVTPGTQAVRDYAQKEVQQDWQKEYRKAYEKLFTAADEAREGLQEENRLRDRQMEVMKERHALEGAALGEARRALEMEREQRAWQEQVNAERRKLDPGAAAAEDLGALGGLLDAMPGGGGAVGKLLKMAPEFQKQFAPQQAAPPAPAPGGAQQAARQAAAPAPGGAQQAAQQAAKAAGGGADGAAAMAKAAGGAGGEAAGLAAGAEGAAGALGGLSAAAGPAAAVIEAYKVAVAGIQQGMRAETEERRKFTNELKMVVADDYLGAFTSKLERATDGFEMMGLAWVYGAEKVKQWVAVAGMVADVQRSFLDLGQKLAPFSGALSEARATSEVRQTLGSMREADNLGLTLGRLESATSRNADALRDLSQPIKKIAAEGVTIPEELIAKATGKIREMARESGVLEKIDEAIDRVVKIIREIFGLKQMGDEEKKTLNQLFDGFGRSIVASDSNLLAPDPALAPPGPPVFPGGF